MPRKPTLPQDPVPLKGTSAGFKQIVRSLTHSGLDAKLAQELVDIVGKLGPVARRPKVFPWGQFGPDGIEVQSVFDVDALDALRDVLTHPRIVSVEVFPRGIVDPDAFSARLRLR